MQTEEGFAPVFFDPRPLTNLVLIDELESLSPVLDMQACLLLPKSMAVCVCWLPYCCCRQQSQHTSVCFDLPHESVLSVEA